METLAAICRHDPDCLLATPFKVVDLDRPGERSERASPGGWN